MAYWNPRRVRKDLDRNYIVIKHTIRGVNNEINGVKFRDGYAVVEKPSKSYYNLKKVPFLKKAQELPLIYLKKLKFISRPKDVQMVYGPEVYYFYRKELEKENKRLEEEQKVNEEQEHIESKRCQFRLKDNSLCKLEAYEYSPNKYCRLHLFQDPKIEELGIEIPKFMDKKTKRKIRNKIYKELENLYKVD